MRTISVICCIVGIPLLAYALMMDTSVPLGDGSKNRVHNLSLAHQQMIYAGAGGLLLLISAIMTAAYYMSGQAERDKAERVRQAQLAIERRRKRNQEWEAGREEREEAAREHMQEYGWLYQFILAPILLASLGCIIGFAVKATAGACIVGLAAGCGIGVVFGAIWYLQSKQTDDD